MSLCEFMFILFFPSINSFQSNLWIKSIEYPEKIPKKIENRWKFLSLNIANFFYNKYGLVPDSSERYLKKGCA